MRHLKRLAVALSVGLIGAPASAQDVAGPYLAAIQADIRNDYEVAGQYYARVLRELQDNAALTQNALVVSVASGAMSRAVELATRLKELDPANQIAALALLADALATEDYATATEIANDERIDYNPLLIGLVRGWAAVGAGDFAEGSALFDTLTANPTLVDYGRYHKGLALASAGNYEGAAEVFAESDTGPLRLGRTSILAQAQILAQLDDPAAALQVVEDALASGFGDDGLEELATTLQAGEDVAYDVVTEARDGAAEAFLVLAAALNRDQSQRLGLLYAQLAAHIRPGFPEAILVAGEILEDQEQFDLAEAAYAAVATESDWYVSAEIGRASALERGERTDAAIEVLRGLAREKPETIAVWTALADTLRRNEAYEDAAEAYSDAINLIGIENETHWVLYYSRGITYERTDRWPEAETDFRYALELMPDQPLVLNYLGYSLLELRRNLDEALEMIKTAVDQRPDDGYITDSLGWAYYRLGRFEEAVPVMERAVELMPTDPILNDHLGDVYWMVGRKREADFQWRRAMSFEPTDTDADRIRRKLEVGLDVVLAEEEAEDAATAVSDDG